MRRIERRPLTFIVAALIAVACVLASFPVQSARAADEQPALANQPVADGAPIANNAELSKEEFWYEYKSYERRDPFLTLIREISEVIDAPPLQRYDVSQMKLVAIVIEVGDKSALVKLPDGTHHMIKLGDKVGLQKGAVYEIMQSKVIVREQKYDFRHNPVDVDYEMKLREEELK